MSQDPSLERPLSARKSATYQPPTSKEVVLKQDIENLRLKNNEKDAEIKKLKSDNRQLQIKIDGLEKTNVKNFQKLDIEKKIRTSAVTEKEKFETIMSKMQLAVSARLKLLGVDFDKIGSISEALDAAFNAINRLVAELQEKENLILELQDEKNNMKNIIEKQKTKIAEYEMELEKQKELIANQSKQIEEQNKWIDEMKQSNNKLTNENESLKIQVEQLLSNISQEKHQSSNTFDDMSKKILQLQESNVEKDSRIKDLEKRVMQLETETSQQKNAIAERNQTIDTLTNDLNSKNNQINLLTNEVDRLTKRLKELEDILSIPKFDKIVQTDITGAIDQQISDYPRLIKEIVALKQAIQERNEHIANLEEENRMLLSEIDELLKKAARFYPCKTNHTGEICIMRSHPKRYLVATGSTDLSCRLWRVDPDSDKRKAVVVQRAIIDGQLDAIAFSDDGTLLAAGTGYNDGPDGYVVIWCLDGSFQEGIVLHTIRSRPTVRFGRVKSIIFSPDNMFVYCGDTTGNIWCFDIEEEKLVAVIQSHHDVVYDVAINTSNKRHAIYSVSHDQSLAAFELPPSIGGMPTADTESNPIKLSNNASSNKKDKNKNQHHKKVSQKSIDLTENRVAKDIIKRRPQSSRNLNVSVEELVADKIDNVQQFKGIIIQKDSRYPFWRIAISSSGKYICCASRKVNIFLSTEKSATEVNEGPRITDADSDHVRTLRIFENYLLVSRTSVPRIKIFDLTDGKEIKTFGCKKPVSQADFLCDSKHIIICQQEIKGTDAKPCIMKIVAYTSNSSAPAKNIPKEPTTPRDDDDDETGIQAETKPFSPKQIEKLQNKKTDKNNDNDNKEKDNYNNENENEVILGIPSINNSKNDSNNDNTKQQSPNNANARTSQSNIDAKNTKKTADKNV